MARARRECILKGKFRGKQTDDDESSSSWARHVSAKCVSSSLSLSHHAGLDRLMEAILLPGQSAETIAHRESTSCAYDTIKLPT